jgi:cation diffusion facilitator CzcD-associated flavoprotein CzcO
VDHSVAIIGAGPYGLSVAAHLKARGIDFRIFGLPMEIWRTQMPTGMHLKSEGFASSLWDPKGQFTLSHYCAAEGIPYQDMGLPVALETFWHYGIAFQRRFVPELEQQMVASIEPNDRGFRLTLDDGSDILARRVVVASGLSNLAHVPSQLTKVPEPFVTHSSSYNDLGGLAGEEVIVVGAGASALDCAALLCEGGASVKLVARGRIIRFHNPPSERPRSLWEKIHTPTSGLGPGWRSRLCTDAPLVFYGLPSRMRSEIVRRHLGPAPGWWTREKVVNKASMHLGMQINGASVASGRVNLDLIDENGSAVTLSADRVIAATGFKVDIRKLPFFDTALAERVRVVEGSPALSSKFESSVPGLYFVGVASAVSLGPMMRFAYGAGFTARRLARHLANR